MRFKFATVAAALSIAGLAASAVMTSPAQAAPDRWARIGLGNPVSVTSGVTLAETTASPTVGAASAGLTGICWSGTSRCWRQNPGITGHSATDIWPRDISGDPNQQYEVVYFGQSNGGGKVDCPEFGGYNIGVFAFVDNNGNGYPISAQTLSGGKYYVGEGANASQYWIWLSNGVIENCWDSRNGSGYTLHAGANYTQMWTSTAGGAPAWQQVHV